VNKLRWGKFYWSDWSDDPALALCSLAAQGLLMRILCLCAQGTPYGYLTVAGKPPSLPALQKLVRPQPSLVRITRLLAELERNGVLKKDSNSTLFSSRMVRDGEVADIRSKAAHSRWSKADLHMQNGHGNGSDACTESRTRSKAPPLAPKRQRAGRKGARGGFAAMAAERAGKGVH
jgi:hypothetical protein